MGKRRWAVLNNGRVETTWTSNGQRYMLEGGGEVEEFSAPPYPGRDLVELDDDEAPARGSLYDDDRREFVAPGGRLALVEDDTGRVAQVVEAKDWFPVAPGLTWREASHDVEAGDRHDGRQFVRPAPLELEEA
jgi:hypothetical protein